MSDRPIPLVREASTPAPLGPPPRQVPWRTIVAVFAVGFGVLLTLALLYKLRSILILVMIAAFLAVMLDPAVELLTRLHFRRGLAVFTVFIVGTAILAGLLYLFIRPIYDAGRKFADDVPGTVHRAETKGQVGKLVRKFHVDKWVTENTPKIRKSFAKAAGPAVSIGRRIVTGIAGLVTVLVLTFLMLLEAPGMIRGFLNALPPKRAEHVRRVGADAARSVSGYVVGNLATSMIAGVVVFVTLLILHVPFASLFGVWVAMVDLLPLVGGLLAGVPTVAFAFLHSVSAGIVSAVVFLIYQQIENHILNPIIMSRTVRLNPLWVLLSVLVGADLLGFVGALLAIPIAGAIQVVARDFWDARRGRPKSTPTTGEAAST